MIHSKLRSIGRWLMPAVVAAWSGLVLVGGCAPLEQETLPMEDKPLVDIPLPDPFPTMKAIRTNKSVNTLGQVAESRIRILRNGYKIRTESIDTTPPLLVISDYENNKEYRLHEGDHIYFEMDISDNLLEKAQRDGLIPMRPNPAVESWDIDLGKSTVNGHPVQIVLHTEKRILTIRGREFKKFDYTLRFEALDLGRQPVRIAYNQTERLLVVIDYKEIQKEEVGPELLTVPEEYMSFTPY